MLLRPWKLKASRITNHGLVFLPCLLILLLLVGQGQGMTDGQIKDLR